MFRSTRHFKSALYLLIISLFVPVIVSAQSKQRQIVVSRSSSIMWEKVNISRRDLFLGPGGMEMRPDLSKVTFIKEEKGGSNKKFRIKDAAGRVWVAKLGEEAQPETAAVRLVWALGYKSEINYFVPTLTVPGKGVFNNVRLEGRPDNIERGDEWAWKKNPFLNTKEIAGLKIMMVMLNNWDIKAEDNNVILKNKDSGENYYVISDLGATFGKMGSSNLPIIWRFGRSKNEPDKYSKSKFLNGLKKDRLNLAYKGRNPDLFEDITVEQGRWLANLLIQLSDKQISDAFRAANYSQSDVSLLTQTIRKRINELDQITR